MAHRGPVDFSFALHGESGVLDLMMTLQYRGRAVGVPTIRYRALAADGQLLPEVTVHSCYGSDRGLLALTPGENTDLLFLRGHPSEAVASVEAELVDLRLLRRRENPVTQVIQNDESGVEIASGGGFHHVTVWNPWAADALCRVVAVALDAPSSGPQGAIEVVELTAGPMPVAANSHTVLRPSSEAYATISRHFGGNFVTVKSFPAAEPAG